jgi:hypothetical protein
VSIFAPHHRRRGSFRDPVQSPKFISLSKHLLWHTAC